jgi:hypothetical protein
MKYMINNLALHLQSLCSINPPLALATAMGQFAVYSPKIEASQTAAPVQTFELTGPTASTADPFQHLRLCLQAAGLGIVISFLFTAMITIANYYAVVCTGILEHLYSTHIQLTAFSGWQEPAITFGVFAGFAAATSAVAIKLWLQARFGTANVTRTVNLPLSIEETLRICQSQLLVKTDIITGNAGEQTFELETKTIVSAISTNHLALCATAEGSYETRLVFHAWPELNCLWGIIGALYCDFGLNKQLVESLTSSLLFDATNTIDCSGAPIFFGVPQDEKAIEMAAIMPTILPTMADSIIS